MMALMYNGAIMTSSSFFSKIALHKRHIVAACLLLAAAFFVPHISWAQEAAADVATTAGFSAVNILEIIGRIIRIGLSFLGVVALLIILYAGWLWMTAGGDDKRVENAKTMMKNGVIGLIIIMLAYAIVAFIFQWLGWATGGSDNGGSTNGQPTIERFSGSLGTVIEDHYPMRNAVDVPRNTRIMVTFRRPVDPASIIDGYDMNGTPTDVSDDRVADVLDTDNVKIYVTKDGANSTPVAAKAYVTPDLRTFVFDPVEYLGSSTETVNYTVSLGTGIRATDGSRTFPRDGYVWTFATGTVLDLTPPTVVAAMPTPANEEFARNILMQVTFSEAMDPTAASGKRTASAGFDNISVGAAGGAPTAGDYVLSNAYRTVTFVPAEKCGQNSCGEDMFCLPPSLKLDVNVKAAPLGDEPPQAAPVLPYAGLLDVSGNSLDGNGDGTAGDAFSYGFSTNGEIERRGPSIGADGINPRIGEGGVALDRPITIGMADGAVNMLMSSSVNPNSIALANKSTKDGKPHEQWFRSTLEILDAAGQVVKSTSQSPVRMRVIVDHGTMLASKEGERWDYGMTINQVLKNQYQNCFVPAKGPGNGDDGMCPVDETGKPNCCQGEASASSCEF